MDYDNSKLIDQCPRCKAYGLRGEATIDMNVYYSLEGKYFWYDEDGNEPTVSSFYCIECGETFTLQEVEEHAEKLIENDLEEEAHLDSLKGQHLSIWVS